VGEKLHHTITSFEEWALGGKVLTKVTATFGKSILLARFDLILNAVQAAKGQVK